MLYSIVPMLRVLRPCSLFIALATAVACGGGTKPGDDGGEDGAMVDPDGAVAPDGATDDAEVDAGPICVPHAETCNTLDDDCDDAIDEDSLVPGASVCDCNGGAAPTSIEISYPAIVEAGVPAQLHVKLEGTSGTLACNPGVVITTTDAAAHPPSEPLMRRYGSLLFATTLVTGPTQSITVTVGGTSATKTGISVVSDRQRVEPAITRIEVPDPSHFTTIPSTNTAIDDFVLDGGITLGDTLYFFASNGLGPKLFSYSVAEGVRQRSNTNARGPDHAWTGGFRALGGAIYFNAYTTEGCIKIFRYVPGDAMVTTPLVDINPRACASLPTQIATLPNSLYGAGIAGSLRASGDDTPFATRFDPVEVAGRIYFTASDGTRYEVYEYVPGSTGGAIPITDFGSVVQSTSPQNLFLLGTEFGTLYFVGPEGTYEHIPGGPIVSAAATPDVPNVGGELASGVRFSTATYYTNGANLMRFTLGETDPVQVSDTSGTSADQVADLSIIDGKVFFSALDAAAHRNVYAHNPFGGMTTTPIPNPCGAGCTDASQPIGMLGMNLYFNARGADRTLAFYRSTWGTGLATEAFAINTAPSDDVMLVASVGDAIYYLAYEGYVGEIDGTKHPAFAAQRGGGRFGFGRRQLYMLSAGSSTPVQVFDTVDTDDADDGAGGAKHPSGFTVVGDALYFVARGAGTYPNGDFVQHLYRHVPGQAGLVSAPIDDGIRVTAGESIAIGGRLYFRADVANDPTAPRWKLFSHAPGEGTLDAADALTALAPGGDDEISLLTNVGGVLVFVGRDASGNGKLYRYRPGDPVLTTASARSNIVAGADDALAWNPTERIGGDASVVDGKLLLTSGGTSGFVYDPASEDVLTAASAVTIAGGSGARLYRYESAYYLVPENASVIDGTVYVSATGGGVNYVRKGRPIAQTGGAVEYFRISPPGGGPVEYVRVCSLYGLNDRMFDGVAYIYVYIPGTDVCGFMATTPTHTDFPGYLIPFPSLGTRQTEFGTTGPSWPLWHDAGRGVTYVRGALSHERTRPRVHKLFAYLNGALTLLSPSTVGNDRASRPYVAGDATYVAVNVCGGLVDFDHGGSGHTCSRVVRYVP